MAVARTNLEIQLDLGPEADAQELDELTRQLRRQLLALDVDSVERAKGPSPPPGARAANGTSLGTLLVTLASTPELFRAMVGTVREWLSRARCRTVKVKLGDSELELTGVSSEQQERLISDWIAHHAVS